MLERNHAKSKPGQQQLYTNSSQIVHKFTDSKTKLVSHEQIQGHLDINVKNYCQCKMVVTLEACSAVSSAKRVFDLAYYDLLLYS